MYKHDKANMLGKVFKCVQIWEHMHAIIYPIPPPPPTHPPAHSLQTPPKLFTAQPKPSSVVLVMDPEIDPTQI